MSKIIAIETSCDETSIAIVEGNLRSDSQASFKLISHVLHSQIADHREFGGVYPNVARREHARYIVPLLKSATTSLQNQDSFQSSQELQYVIDKDTGDKVANWLDREPELAADLMHYSLEFKNASKEIDTIAVTAGPGLAPALWIGVNVARSLACLWKKPLVAVNHMAGHVLSALWPDQKLQTPALALLVSGGHTEIVAVNSPIDYTKIGKTLDDAAGEAFDKVARLLGLAYPGGPEVSKLAERHRQHYPEYATKFALPLPMQHSGDFNFSFSGLKTASKKIIEAHESTPEFIQEFCREFEQAVASILILKLGQAIDHYHPPQVLCGGGVMANQYLRSELARLAREKKVAILFPDPELSGDNAVMIAMSGFWLAQDKLFTHPDSIRARSNWSIATD